MQGEKIVSALIGLSGAVQNNGMDRTTEEVIIKALLSLEGDNIDEIYNLIVEDKFRISPNCRTCDMPCGNTSDYDMEKFHKLSPVIKETKEELLKAAVSYVKKYGMVSDAVLKGIAFLGYELDLDMYLDQIKEIGG